MSMMSNDMTAFWKDIQKDINSKLSIATKFDGRVGGTKIAEMRKCHYKSLLNSVKIGNSKTSVMLDVNQQITSYVTITPFKVLEKCTKNLIGHSRLAFNNHESKIDC